MLQKALEGRGWLGRMADALAVAVRAEPPIPESLDHFFALAGKRYQIKGKETYSLITHWPHLPPCIFN